MSVRVERKGPIFTVLLSRPERRNAVDRDTAAALAEAFRRFDAEPDAKVAVLHGEGGTFCAGADLKAVGGGEGRANVTRREGDGPMGPSRMLLSKPTIAAVAGYAVAGGLELALWCDLRVVEESAIFGVFCRRWGVPLVDGGTVRLPRIIGMGRALDMILTGRPVGAEEALRFGGRRLSFEALADLSLEAARALRRRGVRSGDLVAALLGNGLDFVQLIHAVSLCGARVLPLSTRLTSEELAGQLRASRATRLVYGAGDIGLMGAVARAAQTSGGETFGVIPEHLRVREVGKRDLSTFVVTETMHERKKVMFMNADAIVALPGGPGTLDELFEVLTWRQLGLHEKPVFLLNICL